PLGTHAFIMQEGLSEVESPLVKNAPAHRWLAVGIPGHAGEDKQPLNPAHVERIQIPPDFAKALYDILAPGTTLLVTDAPILEQQTTGVALNIMNSDQPEPSDPKHRYLHAL
ncbi:MAG: hypothetical protein CG438_1179, partial [Methylococcaceae bacterium NSP1-1]